MTHNYKNISYKTEIVRTEGVIPKTAQKKIQKTAYRQNFQNRKPRKFLGQNREPQNIQTKFLTFLHNP